jgi:type IX secretion system PorP/SprF family membrane protein
MLAGQCLAQDNSFSQFYANQLYLNPAFCGTNKGGRLSANYRNQWPHITSKFESYSAGAEIYNPAFQGGLGVFAMNDIEGEGFLRTSYFSVIQSFERIIPKVVRIRAGYQVGIINKRIDWSKLVFGDQLDPIFGQVYQSKALPPSDGRTFADFSVGFLLDFPKIKIGNSGIGNMIGINMAHLSEPNESIIGLNSPLPRKYVVNYGMYIPLVEEPMTGRYLILYPNIVYEKQGNFETTNIGFYIAKNPMLAGIWYRTRKIGDVGHSDAIILNIGMKGDLNPKTSYKVGYSYDFTVSGLAAHTLGAHEVSLILEFKDAGLFTGNGKWSKRKKSNRSQNCEDFGNHTMVF